VWLRIMSTYEADDSLFRDTAARMRRIAERINGNTQFATALTNRNADALRRSHPSHVHP
jgi:hypothetical protein